MTDEERVAWRIARSGKLTASRAHDLLVGRPATLRRIIAEIRQESEWLAAGNAPVESDAAPLRWGNQWEPVARAVYQLETGYEVEDGGFHLLGADPLGSLVGASPDGLVLKRGVLEIKCGMSPSTHISYISNGPSPRAFAQMQFQMWVLGREWAHFVSYDPRHPPSTRMFVLLVEKDEEFIRAMAEKVLALAEYLRDGTDGPEDHDHNTNQPLF